MLAAAGVGATGLLAGCSRFEEGGTETETPQGQWEVRGRVTSEDDEPRSWLVEARTADGSAGSAAGTIPAGEAWEFGLAGKLRDEQLEVLAESDAGASTYQWRPTDCRNLSLSVGISAGEPRISGDCRSGS
jgi:hypothetical protein